MRGGIGVGERGGEGRGKSGVWEHGERSMGRACDLKCPEDISELIMYRVRWKQSDRLRACLRILNAELLKRY